MRHWTPTERQQQAQLIRKQKPWLHSTGARTPKGKQKSKMNARKDGLYCKEMRELNQFISNCRKQINGING